MGISKINNDAVSFEQFSEKGINYLMQLLDKNEVTKNGAH